MLYRAEVSTCDCGNVCLFEGSRRALGDEVHAIWIEVIRYKVSWGRGS